MKLFLTSQINCVAKDIFKKLGSKNLKLVFISTAAEAEHPDKDPEWLKMDRQSLIDAGFEVTSYTITNKSAKEIEDELSKYDVIYISGGNTFYLLEKIQQSGFADVLKNQIKDGKFYIGSSAGSIVVGPDTYPLLRQDRIEKAPNLKGYKGIGLVDFVILPHWGREDHKELYFNERLDLAFNSKNKFIVLRDTQYVEVENDIYKIVDVGDR